MYVIPTSEERSRRPIGCGRAISPYSALRPYPNSVLSTYKFNPILKNKTKNTLKLDLSRILRSPYTRPLLSIVLSSS